MTLFTLDQLIDDILVQLIVALPLCDLLAIRQTCKRFSHLTKLRLIWYTRFSLDVLARQLPIPGPFLHVHDIAANDLEWRTRRALLLDKCWRTPSSRDLLPHIQLSISSEDVSKVILLYGTSNILAVFPSKLHLWHVDASVHLSLRTAHFSSEWVSPSPGSDLVVVRDLFNTGLLAVQSQHSIEILTVDSSQNFVCRKRLYQACGKLVGFYDQWLLLKTGDLYTEQEATSSIGVTLVCSWDAEDDGQKYVLPWIPAYGEFVGFTVFSSYLVIIWDSCLATFLLPESTPIPVGGTTRTIHPSQQFRFRQRIRAPATITACRSRAIPGIKYPHPAPSDAVDCLTIIARPAEHRTMLGPFSPYGGAVSRSLLYVASKPSEPLAFGLASIPLHLAGDFQAISAGPSGRGVWMEEYNIRQCSAQDTLTGGGLFTTVECDDYSHPLATLDCDASEAEVHLDFDDGMGRIAVGIGRDIHVIDML